MTLNEKAGISQAEYNNNPPERSWDRWIDALGGVDALSPLLPFTLPELVKMYQKDRHFNTSRNGAWDRAAGYKPPNDSRSEMRADGRLKDLLVQNGVTCFSSAECVCLLKRCAERRVLELLETALPDEIWAVFERAGGIPERFDRKSVYDYDCAGTFLRREDAEAFESEAPDSRIMKRISLAGIAGRHDSTERSCEEHET